MQNVRNNGTINFSRINFDEENIVFSHRDFTDKLLKTYQISMCEYSHMCDVNIPRGEWITADRDWAINFMEDIRK